MTFDAEEAKNGTGSEYYKALDSQLNDIITKMDKYGLLVSQNTGSVIFDDTATSAVKAAENIDKVEKNIEKTNNAFTDFPSLFYCLLSKRRLGFN